MAKLQNVYKWLMPIQIGWIDWHPLLVLAHVRWEDKQVQLANDPVFMAGYRMYKKAMAELHNQ